MASRPNPDAFKTPYIGHQLRSTYNAWVRHSDKEFDRFGITTTMHLVLVRLWLEDALTQKELVEHTALMQSGTSSVLSRLVKRGLVAGKAGATDGREVRYSLTKKGLGMIASIAPVAMGIRKLASRGLEQEEIRQVQKILGRIQANLGA
jgi:DNA-binding MarR family transcriptional regulator